MFLIDDLLLAPVNGFKFILGQIQKLADQELNDDTVIKEQLLELEMRRELDEISDEEFREREAELFARLRVIKQRQLGLLQEVVHTKESSSFVIEVGGDTVTAAPHPAVDTVTPGSHDLPANTAACAMHNVDCASVTTLTKRTAAVSSLAVAADGRVFFVEDGRRVAVIAAGAGQPEQVLSAERASVQFSDLALDPAFVLSGLLFVGETETDASGRREFRVARYRVDHGAASEGQEVGNDEAGALSPPGRCDDEAMRKPR